MTPFVVFALPRSRTAWLAKFLTYGEWTCGHEELRHVRGLDDVASWFAQGPVGTVETAAAPWWRLLGDVRVAVVRRAPEAVTESMARAMGADPALVARMVRKFDAKLDQIEARVPGVLSVSFDELATEEGAARLFEHCLPFKHDPAHWRTWDAVNVQIDVPAMLRYAAAHGPQLAKAAAVAKHKTLVGMQKAIEPEGVTFSEEPFEDWLRDAQPLFKDHLVLVGEGPDDWKRKNIPLMRKLSDAGAMQIVTARSNGRMFGYLMTVTGPSLAVEGLMTGSTGTFYADPSFPGLGMKLQREALARLKAKGVGEVFFEAGQRGSGPRLGAMYRRLGAVEHGQVYRLSLEA